MWVFLGALLGAQASEMRLQVVAQDFTLSADTSRSVSRIVQRMFRTYERTFSLRYPKEFPVRVRLIADRTTYNREAGSLGSTGATLGFFSPRLGEGVVWMNPDEAEMRGTFVHEASHFLMDAGGAGGQSAWLSEGMAEVFEGLVCQEMLCTSILRRTWPRGCARWGRAFRR